MGQVIVQARIQPEPRLGTGWTGTWCEAPANTKVGDLLVVPVSYSVRVVKVLAVGRTRAAVEGAYTGPLRPVRRKASRAEVKQLRKIEAAYAAERAAKKAISDERIVLHRMLKKLRA